MNKTTARITIQGARVLDPAARLDQVCDVHIADGVVQAIGAAPGDWQEDERIDGGGQWLIPGLVDLSARLREPGQAHKASIASEATAANAGGITTVCIPPDTSPVIDTPSVVEWIRLRAASENRLHVHTLGALTQALDGRAISAMAALKGAGCVGVSNAGRPLDSALVMRRAMEYAATFDLTVHLHSLDHSLNAGGCAHEGPVATRLGLPGIPEAAETVGVSRDLALVEQTGVQAHFCRLSTRRAVEMIAEAQSRGLAVTADICAHQLFLSDADLLGFNNNCHVIPPLRAATDRDALRDALRNGTLSAVCSDHQPHEPDAKTNPFPATEPGISALETLLPLMLRLVKEGGIDLLTAIRRITMGPAEILGVGAGTLQPGSAADICLVDPEAGWRLNPESMLSAGRNTPFAGQEFQGRVNLTLMNGRVVFDRRKS